MPTISSGTRHGLPSSSFISIPTTWQQDEETKRIWSPSLSRGSGPLDLHIIFVYTWAHTHHTHEQLLGRLFALVKTRITSKIFDIVSLTLIWLSRRGRARERWERWGRCWRISISIGIFWFNFDDLCEERIVGRRRKEEVGESSFECTLNWKLALHWAQTLGRVGSTTNIHTNRFWADHTDTFLLHECAVYWECLCAGVLVCECGRI